MESPLFRVVGLRIEWSSPRTQGDRRNQCGRHKQASQRPAGIEKHVLRDRRTKADARKPVREGSVPARAAALTAALRVTGTRFARNGANCMTGKKRSTTTAALAFGSFGRV